MNKALDELLELEKGLIIGLLIGEGHFGGDGKQPQITLKMHVRHEPLLRWVAERIAGAKLYGPYHYDGRHFFQLMIRGQALRDFLELLLSADWSSIDPHSYARMRQMADRYGLDLVSPGGST